MQRITPFLWFDKKALEAAKFYTSIFKNSKITGIAKYGDEGAKASGMQKGSVMTVAFKVDGQEFVALNGGPIFKFSEAVSFAVNCKNQQEVDYYWQKLSKGGEQGPCGWLKDKYGLSWQVVPTLLDDMLQDKDKKKAEKVMKAMLQMKKIDIKKLEQAYKEK